MHLEFGKARKLLDIINTKGWSGYLKAKLVNIEAGNANIDAVPMFANKYLCDFFSNHIFGFCNRCWIGMSRMTYPLEIKTQQSYHLRVIEILMFIQSSLQMWPFVVTFLDDVIYVQDCARKYTPCCSIVLFHISLFATSRAPKDFVGKKVRKKCPSLHPRLLRKLHGGKDSSKTIYMLIL